MVPFSLLDLAPIPEGGNAAQSLHNSIALARLAESLGYTRFWLAEHHGMPGIASAATAVIIGQVAAATQRIRVGAGGIMLPNHAPLIVAEQFGTLEALFPGRIDLGLGRAPGSDPETARAMRRNLYADPQDFPNDVVELMQYFEPDSGDAPVRAVPGAGLRVPMWILGSSLFGAQLAAELGLPFAFASHFAPQQLMDALQIYRARFKPSARLARPYAMAAMNVYVGETDAEGELLATSQQQAFYNLRRGQPGQLPPPRAGFLDSLGAPERAMLQAALACTAAGSPATARAQVEAFVARTGVDELMLTGHVFDHAARLRSFTLLAEAFAS